MLAYLIITCSANPLALLDSLPSLFATCLPEGSKGLTLLKDSFAIAVLDQFTFQ